jgi:hypothetical protein
MDRLKAYVGHARDCIRMAGNATNEEHRNLLLEMAKTWRTLASEGARMGGNAGAPENLEQLLTDKIPASSRLPPAPPKTWGSAQVVKVSPSLAPRGRAK